MHITDKIFPVTGPPLETPCYPSPQSEGARKAFD